MKGKMGYAKKFPSWGSGRRGRGSYSRYNRQGIGSDAMHAVEITVEWPSGVRTTKVFTDSSDQIDYVRRVRSAGGVYQIRRLGRYSR